MWRGATAQPAPRSNSPIRVLLARALTDPVELLAADPAAEPTITLEGALQPLGHLSRAAGHTVQPYYATSLSLPAPA